MHSYITPMTRRGKGKKIIAIIGYGSQGRAIALNLRDSGYNVRVGLRKNSPSRKLARTDKFTSVFTIADAVSTAEIICFAFPDQSHGIVLANEISSNLSDGATLLFLHALSVHFKLVTLPKKNDVILIAPHAPGTAVREKYLTDKNISAFMAVAQDISGKARRTAIELAAGIGIKRTRLIDITFKDEAIGDIFGEQAVLCGGLAMLTKSGFEVLVEKGHNPEHAFLEVAYQLDLIATLIRKHGIEGMFSKISLAARFGSAETGPKLIDKSVKNRMSKIYDSIASGNFARRFSRIDRKGLSELDKKLKKLSHPKLEKAAKKFSK